MARIIFRFKKNQLDEWDGIEKAMSHKYIKRIPKPTGKGWYYIYKESFLHPLKTLAEVFGIKQKKIDDDFEKNNIKKDYGVDKKTFAAHVLEFFTNKEKWTSLFSKKENREKYKKPITQSTVEKQAPEKKGEEKSKDTNKKTTEKRRIINRSLMRKVWSIYSPEAKKIEQTEKENKVIENVENKEKVLGGGKNITLLNDIFKTKKTGFVTNKNIGEIAIELGETGKNGYGLKHIIEQRYTKDKMNVDDITALCALIVETAKEGKVTREAKDRIELQTDNGIVTIVKTQSEKNYKWVLTGFDNWNKKEEATDAIKTVNAQNSYTPEYSDFRKQVGAVITSLNTVSEEKDDLSSTNNFDNLSKEQKNAIEGYVSGHMMWINNYLRGDDFIGDTKESEGMPLTKEEKIFLKNLDSATQQKLNKELPLFRNVDINNFLYISKYDFSLLGDVVEMVKKPNLVPGKDIAYNVYPKVKNFYNNLMALKNTEKQDKGFLSTTAKKELAMNWYGFTGSKNPVVIEFSNTKDVKGLDLREFNKEQQEILLARNQKYVIDDINVEQNILVFKAHFIESEAEEHENRSRAMLGNQNAKKPFTNEELAKEEFNTLNAREKKELDPIGKNIGERVSAMEDTISLSPNSENYAYKDTGYIGGSQKEKIADFWKRKAELGETVDATEIDWNALEENPRYAEKMITKENILGKINYEEMQENNVDPRVAFLISKIYSSIGKSPVGKTEESRKNYVQGINSVVARLKECKTIDDINNFVKDVDGEYSQCFTNQLSKIPELQQIEAKIDELERKSAKANTKLRDYLVELEKQNKTLKEKKALIKEYARKIDPGFENDIDIVSTSLGGHSYSSIKYRYPFWQEEKRKLCVKKRKIALKYQAELKLKNTQKEQWKQLGEKFYKLAYSNSFYNHLNSLNVYDNKNSYSYENRKTAYDKYTTWDWVDIKPKQEKSEIITKLKKRKFEMIVPKTLERVGGRDVSVKTTQELKEMFNLRDVQSGTYVLTDPASAKWHVDNIATGFADLADVTGIPNNLISLNGRIAIAIGARGHGNALAHYESVERVINITKMKGGGSLGHEWFHAFDNLIAEAMNGGNYNQWLTDSEKPFYENKELPNNETNTQVKNAFTNLVKAIMEGDTPETQIVDYSKNDYQKVQWLKRLKKEHYSIGFSSSLEGRIVLSNSLEEAVDVVNKKMGPAYFAAKKQPKNALNKYQKKAIKEYESWIKTAVAFFDDKPEGNEVSVLTGRTVSRFYEDAKKLDRLRGTPYWSTKIEMAARAFEAYLVDKLKSTGRKNDYLSGHADNTEYAGAWYPYPTEKDRIKINKAFDELFSIIKQHNAIQKSLNYIELKKSSVDKRVKDEKFTYFKNKVLTHLEKLQKQERKELKKSWCYFDKRGHLYFRLKSFKSEKNIL